MMSIDNDHDDKDDNDDIVVMIETIFHSFVLRFSAKYFAFQKWKAICYMYIQKHTQNPIYALQTE